MPLDVRPVLKYATMAEKIERDRGPNDFRIVEAGVQGMSTQYIVNPSGERVSAVIPIAEYEALLRYIPEDETAFLLQEPNGSVLLQRIENIRQGRNLIERGLLPDED